MIFRAPVIIVILLAVIFSGCVSFAERRAEAEKNTRLAETHVMLGAGYLKRNQLNVAKEELSKALKLDPNNSQANNIMAVLQWRLKNYKEAERLFRKAVKVDQRNSSAHHNYGAFLCDRTRFDDGIRHFDAAARDPLYDFGAEVNLNAGVCLMRKPVPTEAEKYFREALRINPKLSSALYFMAKIGFDSGQRLSAKGFIERFFQSSDDTPEALLLAVRIEHAIGNKNAEASYALRLRSKFPDSPEVAQLQTLTGARRN